MDPVQLKVFNFPNHFSLDETSNEGEWWNLRKTLHRRFAVLWVSGILEQDKHKLMIESYLKNYAEQIR